MFDTFDNSLLKIPLPQIVDYMNNDLNSNHP